MECGETDMEMALVHMDKDKNSQLDRAEYQAFQDYKKEHSDWRKKLEAK